MLWYYTYHVKFSTSYDLWLFSLILNFQFLLPWLTESAQIHSNTHHTILHIVLSNMRFVYSNFIFEDDSCIWRIWRRSVTLVPATLLLFLDSAYLETMTENDGTWNARYRGANFLSAALSCSSYRVGFFRLLRAWRRSKFGIVLQKCRNKKTLRPPFCFFRRSEPLQLYFNSVTL